MAEKDDLTPVQKARKAFLDNQLSSVAKLQGRLHAWQVRNFGEMSKYQMLAGIMEELGELSHALLKNDQQIRGFEDEAFFLEKAGDSLADMRVYMEQLCTILKLDAPTLFEETANQVMKRDWVKDSAKGGQE